jgi:lipid II:glycine glycyltransferase (peptidoglycan interpeptide bridge formation enzyme)
MSNKLLVDGMGREEWTRGCAAFVANNIYQAWDYGESHNEGKLREVSRAALMRDGNPVVMAQFQIKRLPIGGIGIADTNWGPLWHFESGAEGEACLTEFLEGIQEFYCVQKGLQLRFEIHGVADKDQNDRIVDILTKRGFIFKEDMRAYRTILLDLTPGLDRLRASFHGKWRNALNKAERAGLEAECGSTAQHFERFLQLYTEMWAQKRFPTGVHMDAVQAFHMNAAESDKLLIWIIRDQGVDVAAGVFSALGNTMLYFLGATSPRMRRDSNPGYLIQWLNLQKAIELGLRYYDLGGLTDLPDSGVDQFKIRMGGVRVMFPGWFEAPTANWSYKALSKFENGFRTARSLITGR